jgi:hypothetical protein
MPAFLANRGFVAIYPQIAGIYIAFPPHFY